MIRLAALRVVSLLAFAVVSAVSAAEVSIGEGKLEAETGEFDLREGFHHFWGNVRFRYPGVLDLDCDDLKIRLLPGGSRIDRLIASNQVVMTIVQLPSTNAAGLFRGGGSTNRVYAALAEYVGTNDIATLTGSPAFGQPWVERSEGSFKADQITFDRAHERLVGRGNFMLIIKPESLPKEAPRAAAPGTK